RVDVPERLRAARRASLYVSGAAEAPAPGRPRRPMRGARVRSPERARLHLGRRRLSEHARELSPRAGRRRDARAVRALGLRAGGGVEGRRVRLERDARRARQRARAARESSMNIVLWVLQVVLALLCLAGGGFKALHPEDPAKQIRALPPAAWRALGVFE